ncbi:MAG: PIN domain-containing protein [Bacteroidales bacterium]|nr:PIN domain-containing protein [Bacteroidales bacterium]
MLIYLDNCSFNRPFDDQSQIRIRIETEAKIHIQEQIIKGNLTLTWSYILDYENSANPFPERKDAIGNWKKHAVSDIDASEEIIKRAEKLKKKGIKSKDALHISCAIKLNCKYFITTDRGLIKKLGKFEQLYVLNPVDFINIIEEKKKC